MVNSTLGNYFPLAVYVAENCMVNSTLGNYFPLVVYVAENCAWSTPL